MIIIPHISKSLPVVASLVLFKIETIRRNIIHFAYSIMKFRNIAFVIESAKTFKLVYRKGISRTKSQ